MTNDNHIKSYWSHEIAKLLDISTSSLRRWSIILEATGYPFIRDENDKRAYLQSDIMPLQKMRELLTDGMSLENAANAVVLRYSEQISNSQTTFVYDENNRLSQRLQKIESSLEHIEQWIQKQQLPDSRATPVCNECDRSPERSQEHFQQIQLSFQQLQQQMQKQQSELLREVAIAKQKRGWKFWT